MIRLWRFWRLPWYVAGGACRFTKEGVLDNTASRQYICTQGSDRICDRYRKFYESVRESCLGPYSSVFFPGLNASIAIPPAREEVLRDKELPMGNMYRVLHGGCPVQRAPGKLFSLDLSCERDFARTNGGTRQCGYSPLFPGNDAAHLGSLLSSWHFSS